MRSLTIIGSAPDKCGVPTGPGGVFSFWSLINNKFLNADGTAASGMDYRFDNCSQTVAFHLFFPSHVKLTFHLAICLQPYFASHDFLRRSEELW